MVCVRVEIMCLACLLCVVFTVDKSLSCRASGETKAFFKCVFLLGEETITSAPILLQKSQGVGQGGRGACRAHRRKPG